MSASTSSPPRRLVVDTGVPTAEIFVVDGLGKVVARGVGTLSEDLPPGIYKVRIRVGERVHDDIIELALGDSDYSFTPTKLPLAPAVPFARHDTGDLSASAEAAHAWSRAPRVHVGEGSGIFLFVGPSLTAESQGATLDGRSNAEIDRLARALTLHRTNGDQVVSLDTAEARNGCLGLAVDIEPGNYLLRFNDSSAPVEQTIVAAPGWQTQVFLIPQLSSGGLTFDLSESAVLMVRHGEGFTPDDQDLHRTEAARQALAAGRGTAAPVTTLKHRAEEATDLQRQFAHDPEQLELMLRNKFRNPMLGIYGAHMLLLQAKPDLDLLREVTTNLRKLIGDHPDVMSLLLCFDSADADSITFPEPPMLSSSWALIVRSSRPGRELVPRQSYAFRIGGNLRGGGPCLTWKVPSLLPETATDAASAVDWGKLLVLGISLAREEPDRISRIAESAKLNASERAVLSLTLNAGAKVKRASDLAYAIDSEGTLGPLVALRQLFATPDLVKETKGIALKMVEQLGASVGLPHSAAAQAAASLIQKIDPHLPSGLLAGLASSVLSLLSGFSRGRQ